MREELEGAITSKKNAEYDRSRMAREHAQMQQDCFSQKSMIEGLKKVKGELENEIMKLDEKIDNYRLQLLDKDEELKEKKKTILELEALIVAANNNESELAAAKTAIANLQNEVEETKTELVNCETQLQQALQSISSPAVVSGENETTEALQDEIALGVRQRLIEFVGERKSQAKDTRNWFQANKMIAELEKILSIE